MKVLIICGTYPPIKCGVGDYTFNLAKALTKIPSLRVGVLTSVNARDEARIDDGVQLFPVIDRWDFGSLGKIIKIINLYAPDLIHIQYPAFGYQASLMTALPFILKFKNIPIVQTWHEHVNECTMVGWKNLLACNALIYVRYDFISKLSTLMKFLIKKVPNCYIPNATVIPPVRLSETQRVGLKKEISLDKKIVCFFGFANPNKGLEHLFEVVDPIKFHLLLICELDPLNSYQNVILEKAKNYKWANNVTITGYLSEQDIGELFSVVDAAVFPFPGGAGSWNSSLKAAQASGIFTLATSADSNKCGYDPNLNTYYVPCDAINSMPSILEVYAGRRIGINLINEWDAIALEHYSVYRECLI